MAWYALKAARLSQAISSGDCQHSSYIDEIDIIRTKYHVRRAVIFDVDTVVGTAESQKSQCYSLQTR